MKTIATLVILIACVLCVVPAHIVGIFYAAIKNGYFAGIERFEDFLESRNK